MSIPSTAKAQLEAATYRKIMWRLMPYLFLCYVLAYVDRVNVGFAKLQMQQDLGMSDAVFGTGAGVFFIGYFFFEVPANMILQKIGARRWIGPIMIAWGIVSACTMFVRGAASFYAIRFVLGIVESGFFPGVILYLTYWYPSRRRARMVATFMSAVAISGVIAGPVSGWILARMSGLGHLEAWQWLFLAEGIPSMIVGLVTLYFLTDNPAKAHWLTEEEKGVVSQILAAEDREKRAGGQKHGLGDAFRNPKVWLMAIIYFGSVMGNYGLAFWLPQVLKDNVTSNPIYIGWISAIPWGVTIFAMILAGRHSDATGERRWHITIACVVAAAGFAVCAIPGIPGTALVVALTFAAMGIMSMQAMFWALPTGMLTGAAAAAGIAWINSLGNLAGYVSPSLIGLLRDRTHSMSGALLALSGAVLVSAAVTLYVVRGRQATI